MPVGPNSYKVPPPWLIAMQRYGPPPSYPNLKISGLNAPIPESCSFGYHAGGWGKKSMALNVWNVVKWVDYRICQSYFQASLQLMSLESLSTVMFLAWPMGHLPTR